MVDWLAVPVASALVRLVRARPCRHQAHIDRGIFTFQDFGHAFHRRDQHGGVAGLAGIQRAVALEYNGIPTAPSDLVQRMIEVPVDAGARMRLEVDVELQARLDGERFEQRRHPTCPIAVQVGDGVRLVIHDRGAGGEDEAVADE